ncbi:hypothetical protein WJX73_008197 [Symbiochloris irregularis]|uniref:Mitochondrial carrier n=1 Tax=Symbiochloris irregularis TaxID=706552 RepID=A0AAW1PGE0_9CHLO
MPDNKQQQGGGAGGGLKKVARDVFAGTCGGIVVTLVGQPFDTVKVRLQTQPPGKQIYNGPIDCVRKTIQWEGPTGLYKGVSSPLAGQMFHRAAMFAAFGYAKRWISTNPDGTTRPLTAADLYKAGAITGFTASFTEGPIDFYKSQVQYQIIKTQTDSAYKPAFTSVFQCVRQTLSINGVKGPFQGLGATILRNVPANSVYLGSFEFLKMKWAAAKGISTAELPALNVLAAAGTGGLLYWSSIYPIDVIKSAMQTDSINPAERQYANSIAAAKALWKDGGIRRFYKGFTPCIARAAPANAFMLYTVDKITTLIPVQG